MAVLLLVSCRAAHVLHFDMEVQALARQRVIAADHDLIVLDRAHPNRHRLAGARTRLERHAGLDLDVRRELRLRHRLVGRRIVEAVALGGRHRHITDIADLLAGELALEAGHDVLTAVQIEQRIAAERLVGDRTVVEGQAVVNGDDVAVGDRRFHRGRRA
jgi:hypothetical protein